MALLEKRERVGQKLVNEKMFWEHGGIEQAGIGNDVKLLLLC